MKRLFFTSLFALFVLAACNNKGQEVTQEYLKGTWQFLDRDSNYSEYAFKGNDGKVCYFSTEIWEHFDLDFKLKGNTLFIKPYWGDSFNWKEKITIINDSCLFLNGNVITIEQGDTIFYDTKYQLIKLDGSELEYFDFEHPIKRDTGENSRMGPYRYMNEKYMDALYSRYTKKMESLSMNFSHQDIKEKLLGKWEFDYTQAGTDLEGKVINYKNHFDSFGATFISFNTGDYFEGSIWGSKYDGTYILKNDTLYLHSDTEGFEGMETNYIVKLDSKTLKLATCFDDQLETSTYIKSERRIYDHIDTIKNQSRRD